MRGVLVVVLFWVPVLMTLYHWAVFPLILAFLLRFRRSRTTAGYHAELPRVTIVVAMRNEEKTAAAKVRNCLEQDYPANRLEVLVGSDASEDLTDEIVRSFTDSRVRLVRLSERTGKAGVLNVLMQSVTEGLVLLTDADVLLSSDAVTRMVDWFASPDVSVVQLNYHRLNRDGSFAEGVFDRWEVMVKGLEGDLGSLVTPTGIGMMIRRSQWQPIPADTIHDDLLIGVRPLLVGGSSVFERRAEGVCRTEVERVEFLRKRKMGRGNMQAAVRLLPLLPSARPIVSFVFLSHKTLRAFLPFALPGILVGCALQFGSPLYEVFFWLQVAAYALIPVLLTVKGRGRRLLLPSYYLLMNIALLVGALEYVVKPHRSAWDRTPRG